MPKSSQPLSETTTAATEMPPYELTMPPLVVFGSGRVADVGRLAATLGRQVWLVTGGTSFADSGAREPLLTGLVEAGLPHSEVARSAGEPTVDQLAAALAALPADRSGVVVVAVGGGATIDLAKALAALAANVDPCDRTAAETAVIDRLEGVGRNLPISRAPLPVVAVPTTAGTGAEATRNAVISCPRRRFKKSLRSQLMVPRVAVLDPDLTQSCSRQTVAAAGLDCLTQLIESFISRRRWSLPQALVLEAFPRGFAALPKVLADPTDDAARAALLHAAFISGVSLGNSGLGLAHGVAAALGVECGTPHGLACAVMLPVALQVNRHEAAPELARLDASLGGPPLPQQEAVDRLIDRVERLCSEAGIPRSLSALGLSRDRLDWLAKNSGGNSMRGNPVQLATADLLGFLESVYE